MIYYAYDKNGYYLTFSEYQSDFNSWDNFGGMTTTAPDASLYTPKWAGTSWIEGKSQAEIDAANAKNNSLPVTSSLEQTVSDLAKQVAALTISNANLANKVAQIIVANNKGGTN